MTGQPRYRCSELPLLFACGQSAAESEVIDADFDNEAARVGTAAHEMIHQWFLGELNGEVAGNVCAANGVDQSDVWPLVHVAKKIANEMGLVGAIAVVLLYLLLAWRGFRIATTADDGFSKLLAAGLATAVAFQVFVIVGGVIRLLPLTGLTLPFVSYGGSSVTANFAIAGLLLCISQRANRERPL